MHPISVIYEEVVSFFSFDGIWQIIRSRSYEKLWTIEGIEALLGPLIPVLLVIELLRGCFNRKFHIADYKLPFFTLVANRFISRFFSIAVVLFCIHLFQPYAIIKTKLTWYWLIYGYIIWEFSHFVYHYLGHKARLLWCLHSTHHAPEFMNLSVTYTHFFLEAPYADLIRTSICILMGVDPFLLGLIMFIDGTWGALIHVGENLLKNGSLGFLNSILLTPSHHRVHHARNPLYMDTNFCNLLNIWDHVFGTYQEAIDDLPIEYGITRPIRKGSFTDAYFGEFPALWKDIRTAPGLYNKIRYLYMPPGWSHTGNGHTAKMLRRAYLRNQSHQGRAGTPDSPAAKKPENTVRK